MDAPAKVALVTGGARRVGRAIVLRLAAGGFDVAFTYHRSQAEADELAKMVTDGGRRALAICADLTKPEAAVPAVQAAFAGRFARLDVLVNNASLYQPTPLSTVSAAQMRQMMAIHAEAPVLLCQAFGAMLRSAGGHVVNMVDLLAERPWPAYLAYCASKGALATLTAALARELAPQVTVNGIAPGVAEWPDDMPQTDRERYLQRVPLSRAGSPGEVAELVHYLVTAGSYITGQIIRLDGGRSLT